MPVDFSVLNAQETWAEHNTDGGRGKSAKAVAKAAAKAVKADSIPVGKPSKVDVMSRKKKKANDKTKQKIAAAKAVLKVEETTPDPIPVQTGAAFGWSDSEED
jgi:hypothetical protein